MELLDPMKAPSLVPRGTTTPCFTWLHQRAWPPTVHEGSSLSSSMTASLTRVTWHLTVVSICLSKRSPHSHVHNTTISNSYDMETMNGWFKKKKCYIHSNLFLKVLGTRLSDPFNKNAKYAGKWDLHKNNVWFRKEKINTRKKKKKTLWGYPKTSRTCSLDHLYPSFKNLLAFLQNVYAHAHAHTHTSLPLLNQNVTMWAPTPQEFWNSPCTGLEPDPKLPCLSPEDSFLQGISRRRTGQAWSPG